MKSNMAKVTENSGSRKQKQLLFSQAGEIAVRSIQNSNLPLTYTEGNKIFRELPNGKRTIIAIIPESTMQIPKKFEIK